MKASRNPELLYMTDLSLTIVVLALLGVFTCFSHANRAYAQSPPIHAGSKADSSAIDRNDDEFREFDATLAQRFLNPFYLVDRSETLALMLELRARLHHDRNEAEQQESDRRTGHARYDFATSDITLPTELAEEMTQHLAREQSTSMQANAILAVLLLTRSESADAAVEPIRALSGQLARIRGERPDPLLVAAISAFVVNHTTLIKEIDPRHRVGLLEALLEVRDLAGIHRATRGYEGHQLQSILQRFAGILERHEGRYVDPSGIPDELSGSGSEVLKGMHRLDDGTLVWIHD